jgi:chromate transporter
MRPTSKTSPETAWEVFFIFLRLGCTAFGGPVAHLAYFRDEFVSRRRWLSDTSYADLVALCQSLPGATSSQVGMALGLARRGYPGALAAWVGFTLPSALALILLALGMTNQATGLPQAALHGLKVVAVAVVAVALWGMAKPLCLQIHRVTLMASATILALAMPTVSAQIGIILLMGLAGLFLFKPAPTAQRDALPIRISRSTAGIFLCLFFALLVALPTLEYLFDNRTLSNINTFYRSGSLVFGGGHVVLPLLQSSVVPTGWVSNDSFLAGYGAAQAVPGPLFSFAAFLGAAMNPAAPWLGGLICLLAIFAPSFLLLLGILPFWEQLRQHQTMQAALIGIQAAVVGILIAAFYQPVWTSAILLPQDFALAVLAWVALVFWKLPVWLVVIAGGSVAWVLSLLT